MSRKRHLFWVSIVASAGAVSAQELAPDDPSISGDLAVWFRDAAKTFDPDTGTWADSSGNGRDAVPVGLGERQRPDHLSPADPGYDLRRGVLRG